MGGGTLDAMADRRRPAGHRRLSAALRRSEIKLDFPAMEFRARRLLVFFTAINLLNYLDRYVLAAVLEPLGRDLKLSDEQLGRFPFFFLIVYMLAAPCFGALAERFSRTRLVAAGIFLWSLATAGAALAHSYAMLVVARALVGVGEAAYATLAPAILSDVFPEEKRAARFTWFYLAIPVGSALGYAFGGIVGGQWGWRASFLLAGVPGMLLALWMFRTPDPPRGALDDMADRAAALTYWRRLRLLFANRMWLACTASYVGYTFAMGALSHWTPTLLQRRFAVSATEAGIVFGGFAVATGLMGTFIGGVATDRLQRRFPDAGVWISGLTLVAAAPVVAFALSTRRLTFVYLSFFVGMLLLFINTSPVNALTMSCLPASLRASGAALNVFLIHLLGDALSPEWVGRISTGHGASGDALAGALRITIPAVVVAGAVLWFARGRRLLHPSEAA